jgi:hypothetical protein
MSSFGITLLTDLLIESISVSQSAEVAVIMKSDTSFAQANAHDYKQTFSVKGRGTPTVVAGGNTGGPAILDGKVIITSVKKSTNNGEFNSYEFSGEAYPHAT